MSDSSDRRIALTDPDDAGKWFDPAKTQSWEEATRWDGSNHISVATGSQWDHERLHRTANGNWILHTWSQWQGTKEEYGSISAKDAAVWLVQNEHDVPDELQAFVSGMEV